MYKKTLKKVLNAIGTWWVVTGLNFFAWITISWIDVISHNLDPNPQYQCWNFFELLFR